MDMSDYKDEFVSEAKEHLDSLNDGLLELEKNPESEDNINKIFRSFHTLKGNAATMGYIKFSELAHKLEDVLSKIRDKELKITQDIMDEILEGVDALESGLTQIENDNPEHINTESLIDNLNGILESNDQETLVNLKVSEVFEPDDKIKKIIEKNKAKKLNIFRIILLFKTDNQLKGAKAIIIANNITATGQIISSTPSLEDIKAVKFNDELELIISSKKTKDEIIAVIKIVTGVINFVVLNLEEKYVRPENFEHDQKEISKKEITEKHQREMVKQVQSVKVDMKMLDKLMNMVGELLISNIRLQDIDKKKDYSALKPIITSLDRLIMELHDEFVEVRMIPVGSIFNRFPRMIRDLSNKENKKINFVIEGSDIKFDRSVLDKIGDPIVHLLRNSVDHGIETPEKRVSLGKSDVGEIKLIAKREKNNAVIEITDDGGGIDIQAVKESCIKKGILTKEKADKMTDNQLQMMIFNAGVSTNKIVTEISGRGVGMDVVLNTINELGGHVELSSEVGKGTHVKISLPLTLAIVTALLVKIKKEIYAIPLVTVDQIVGLRLSKTKTIQGHEVFVLRNMDIPLLWMHELIGVTDFEKKENLTVVIINKDENKIGLVVDEIISQQQILIKGMQDIVKDTKGCAGATILGDGTVALIFDISSVLI